MNNIITDPFGKEINLETAFPITYYAQSNGVPLHYVETNKERVLEMLTSDLIAKKVNQCKYISRIKRVNNYDGTQTITVYYSKDIGGGKRVYRIADK